MITSKLFIDWESRAKVTNTEDRDREDLIKLQDLISIYKMDVKYYSGLACTLENRFIKYGIDLDALIRLNDHFFISRYYLNT